MINKILVAIAGAEASIITGKYAICLAKKLDAELIAIYVVDEKSLEDLLRAKILVETEELEYERDLEEQGTRYLNHIKRLAEAKGVTMQTHLSKGVVHNEVISRIQDDAIDLLVMGRFREALSRRETFYDEGERIFREADCPILVVKGDEDHIEDLYESL